LLIFAQIRLSQLVMAGRRTVALLLSLVCVVGSYTTCTAAAENRFGVVDVWSKDPSLELTPGAIVSSTRNLCEALAVKVALHGTVFAASRLV
jgi:hypothetical protein